MEQFDKNRIVRQKKKLKSLQQTKWPVFSVSKTNV